MLKNKFDYKKEMPAIRLFSDYRSFFCAFVLHTKARRPRWSIRKWAADLEVKDVSTVTKILNGQRRPSMDLSKKFIEYFKFDEIEAEHFLNLVKLEKLSKKHTEAAEIIEKLNCGTSKVEVRHLDTEHYFLLSNWFCLAILELSRLANFRPSAAWISARLALPVSAAQIKQAIKLLERAGLVIRADDGGLVPTQLPIRTSNDLASRAIQNFHEQSLANAVSQLKNCPVEKREFQSSLISVKASDIARAKEAIRKFRLQFCKDFEVAGADSVFQLQIQYFPLTKES